MNKILRYFFFCLVAVSCGGSRQATEPKSIIGSTIEYDPHPEKSRLAILHNQLIHSESFIQSETLVDAFMNSFPESMNPYDFEDEAAFTAWVTENLSKTSFENVNQALGLREKSINAIAKSQEDNAEYYEVWMDTDPNSWQFLTYSPSLPE